MGFFSATYFGGGGASGALPEPNKVLAGVEYGPGEAYTGTAPESEKSHFPQFTRGDDYSEDEITTIVADPGDLGSLASCSVVFAGHSKEHGTGWRVTTGSVEDLGGGLLKLKSSMVSADTIACKPGPRYEWTHTLIDATGKIRTQKNGITKLIDGYAVDRYEET